jgi:hypothetical protein
MADPTPAQPLPPDTPPPPVVAPKPEPAVRPEKPPASAAARSARLRKALRGLSLFGFTLLAALLGIAYPALARGSELLYADFQNRWFLLPARCSRYGSARLDHGYGCAIYPAFCARSR